MRSADYRTQATSRPVLSPRPGRLVGLPSRAKTQRDLVVASLLRCPGASEKRQS